jgi:amidophosphoribosyltransferase
MLVDDSIVRGTTCSQIIQMARDAGAKNVYFASAAPAIRFPNVYGIDMPAASELIAHNRTEAEIAELIGADWLVYQDLEDLLACSHEGNEAIEDFECSVFDGCYKAGTIDEHYLNTIEAARSEGSEMRIAASQDGAVVGLHNDV